MRIDVTRQCRHPVMNTQCDCVIEENLIQRERNVLAPPAHDVVEQLFLNEILIGRPQAAACLFQRIALRISGQRPCRIEMFLRSVMRGSFVVFVRKSQPVDGTRRIGVVAPHRAARKGYALVLAAVAR